MKTKKANHWFFAEEREYHCPVLGKCYIGTIHTYGLGNHPCSTYNFEEKEDFDIFKKSLIEDDYEFCEYH